MSKETNAFFLIVFLFVVLIGWWLTTSFVTPLPQSSLSQIAPSPTPAQTNTRAPLVIHHATSGSKNIYSGSINVSGCDMFSSGISAQGTNPPHLKISFTIEHPEACTTPTDMVVVPFAVSFSFKASTQKPILDSVEVNDAPNAFSIVEDTQ